MTFNTVTIIRIIGVILAGFLWIHFQGMPWGLLSAVATALLFLP
jgi:hypothetical protein